MDKKSIGEDGEMQALTYLKNKGYDVLEKNYRFGKGEIDLIGLKNNLLIFVEVKKRFNSKYGHPEEFVSKSQQKMILKTAEHYIYAINWQKNIRFDIISITGSELLHIEDAFY